MFKFLKKDDSKVVPNLYNIVVTDAMAGENIQLATIAVRDYLRAVKDNVIVPYANNRGKGQLYLGKVRRIAQTYDSNKLGVITIADNGDGTFTLCDAHHRTQAMTMKLEGSSDAPPFTQEQLDQRISLHVASKEDFIRVYTGLNASNGHSSRQKVLNVDLGLGSLVEEILSLQKVESSVEHSFYTALARCTYAYIGEFGRAPSEMTYADISVDRTIVSADAGLSKEEFKIRASTKQQLSIAKAIDYVNSVYMEFKKLNNLSTRKNTIKLNATARGIIGSAGLFGFLLWDKLSGRELITYLTPKNLAMRITEKDAQIERQAKDILNSSSRDSAANKIVSYVTTKKRI